MHLFYTQNIQENYCYLEEEEAKHCTRVLRKKIGDDVIVTNGRGQLLSCEITEANPKKAKLKILSVQSFQPKNYKLHIAIAPTKNMNRTEWFVEKATEIGIDIITPVFCAFSERKTLRTNRLEKVMLSAAKQSLKYYFPKIQEPISYQNFIKEKLTGYQKFIAHNMGDMKIPLKLACIKGGDALVVVGPEGGFSGDEITLAQQNGFSTVMLGNNRLRTETAAIVACHTVNLVNE